MAYCRGCREREKKKAIDNREIEMGITALYTFTRGIANVYMRPLWCGQAVEGKDGLEKFGEVREHKPHHILARLDRHRV